MQPNALELTPCKWWYDSEAGKSGTSPVNDELAKHKEGECMEVKSKGETCSCSSKLSPVHFIIPHHV